MELHRGSDHAGNHTAGWVASVLLHSGIVVGTLLFVQRVEMAPPSEPFTWNVALVSSDSPPAPSSTSPSPVESPPPVSPATPSTIPREQPVPPMTELGKSEHRQHKVPALTVMTPPTPLPQAEQQPVDPVPPAPDAALVAAPLPVEPIKQAPTADESFNPSSQTASRETSPPPPAHPESPSLMSSVPSPSPEPAPSITSHVTTSPSETSVPVASSAPQVAALAPPGSNRPARVDYGWLSEVILRRVEELKRYPAEARVDRTEGKVVVKAVINEDGSVDEVEIFQSSGSTTLDQAAVDLMRRAAPFSLPHLLGKPRVTIKIPMNYRLDR